MPDKSSDKPFFEIKISRYGPASYNAEILSPVGPTSVQFQFPLKKLVIEATLADFRRNIQAPRSPQQEYIPETQGALTPEQLGGTLFKSVFQPNVFELYKKSRQLAKQQGQPLPVILNIDPQASDLINLPWEFLYDTSGQRVRGQFLAFDQSAPIMRRWLRAEPFNFTYDKPLRVLLVSASPDNSIPLKVERECQFIKDKLNDLNRHGEIKVRIEELQATTLSDLKQVIRNPKKTPHIIHFMGHGGLGSLLLEDAEGSQKSVSEKSLAIILKNAPSLRLVMLNACQTAQADLLTEQLGVAQSLADIGIPAIVAMQFLISDKAALTFAREFYQLIAEGHAIDSAVTWARIAIQNEFAESTTKEWATPVLYLQTPDGNILFDLLGEQQKPPEPRPSPDEAASQTEASRQEDDQSAASKTTEQMRREAEEKEERILHLQKMRREHIKRLREREIQAAKFGINVDPYITIEIADIRAKLKEIDQELKQLDPEMTFSEIVPPPPDTHPVNITGINDSKIMEKITREGSGTHSQGLKLYTEAIPALKKGDWAQAVSYLSRAQKLAPGLLDVNSQLEQARQQWRQTVEGKNEYDTLDVLYDQAENRLTRHDWDGAARLLERIIRIDAGYKNAYELALDTRAKADKEKAEQEKQARLKELYTQAQVCLQEKNWGGAVDALTQVVELEACYQDCQESLNEASKQRDLQEAYQEGEKQFKAQDWAKAVAAFGKVTSIDGAYRDAAKLLIHSRRQKQLETWLQEAEDYLNKGEWSGAIEVLEQNQVADERPEAKIPLNYAYAQRYYEQNDWARVVKHLKEVVAVRPNYRPDVNTLYQQADEELRLQQQFNKAITHIEQDEWAAAKATLEGMAQVRDDPIVREKLAKVNQEIQLAGIYEKALNALELKQWAKTISYLKDIPPDYRDTQARLTEAKQQLELDMFYRDGLEAADSGRWVEAVTAFQHVAEIAPTFRDTRQELKNAQDKVTLEHSFNQGIDVFTLGKHNYDLALLDQAVGCLETVANIDPRYQGVGNRLREAKRERFLLQHYQQGEEMFAREQWAKAIEAWQVVVKDENEPGYHGDCAQRLAQARHQQHLADLYREANQHCRAQEWDNAVILLEELEQAAVNEIYQDTPQLLAKARLQQKLLQHYRQAEQLTAAEQWDKAIEHLEQIQAEQADYRQADVERMLEQSSTNREATRNYETGLEALKAENWAEAVTCFGRAYKLKADFRDVETRLRQARQQETLHKRYQVGLEEMSREAWDEAINHLIAMQSLDPDFKDARQKLEEAQRQKQLAADYRVALAHFEAERWVEARDALADILARQKDYKEAPARRNEAQQQLDMADKYERALKRIEQANDQPENWQLAAELLAQVAAWQPDYQDTPSLLTNAQQQAHLYNLYQRATVLGAKNEITDLEQAIQLLGQLTKVDLNYRDAATLKGQYEAALIKKREEKRKLELKTRHELALESAGKGDLQQVLTLLEQMTPLDARYQAVHDQINRLTQQCMEKYRRGQQLKKGRKEREAVAILQEYQHEKSQLPTAIQAILRQNSPE